MSLTVSTLQIREYHRQAIVLGGAAQVLPTIQFKLDKDTRAIIVALERVVTTVPPNDALLPAVILSYQLQLNSNIIIPPITAAQFNAVIRNLEQYEIQTISNGLIFPKLFVPPIKKGTQVNLNLTINTLALGTTTPAATAAFTLKVYGVDRKGNDPPPSNRTLYLKLLPRTANVAANTQQQIQLGVDPRTLIDIVFTELTAGVLSDTWLAEIEMVGDSQRIAMLGTAIMKEMYRSKSNQAVPAGYYLFSIPTPLEPSNYQSIIINFDAHTATANAALEGWERFFKTY